MKKRIWIIILFLLIGLEGMSISAATTDDELTLPESDYIVTEDEQTVTESEQIVDDETILTDTESTVTVTEPAITDAESNQIIQAAPGITILKDAKWIHGTAANVEYPSNLYRTDRKGWGTTYWGKNKTFNWFHFAIPTKVISNGVRNKVAKTFVLFKTDGNARITNVHIWDGPNKIKSYDGLSLSGDHSTAIDSSNTFVIDPPRYVFWGIGISVGVEFGNKDNVGMAYPGILFTTAGEDLYQFGSDSDSDGDALKDSWEAYGYDFNNDGSIDVNLPAMGADPFHKDIFVEVDWMAQGPGETRSHAPLANVMTRAQDTFAKAPYANNPDRKPGINLHTDLSNQVPHDADLNPAVAEFEAIKANNFQAARQDTHHYALFAHGYNGGGSSGLAWGNNFMVTLGTWGTGDTADAEVGTFVHELGHNLGLPHGGTDGTNYKPNYLSIMNYHFQIDGVYRNGKWGNYDYQRIAPYTLNENSLNESKGIANAIGYGTKWYSPGCTNPPKQSTVYKPIDWNWNGVMQNSVAVDLNCDGSKTTLTSWTDWKNIVYNGGTIGGIGPEEQPRILIKPEDLKELTFEEYTKNKIAK